MTQSNTDKETRHAERPVDVDVRAHLGIRFAEIEHRFAPPTPTKDSVPRGLGYGPSPMQLPSPWLPQDLQFSEDCLNLNVWAPNAGTNHPVAVWLYGGGFEGGSNAVPQTNGSVLAAKGPMVVVSLNYRVGALGFSYLADKGGSLRHATNLGVQDVIAGLQWIKDNIHTFGGDPSKVTVLGESAGGFIAAALAAAPSAKGLFQRLALFSGAASRLVPVDQAKQQTEILLGALNISGKHDDLLQRPAQEILAAQQSFIAKDIGARNGAVPQALGVVLDAGEPHAVLQKHPLEAFRSGELADIPLLVSSTQDEITSFRNFDKAAFDPASGNALHREMKDWGIPADRIPSLYNHYSEKESESPGTAKERMLTDWIYRLPAARLVQAQAMAGGSAHLAAVSRVDAKPAGHGCDVNAIFGIPAPSETAAEAARRSSITEAVVAFVTTGEPGWPAATTSDLHAFSFGDQGLDATADYSLLLELWDGISRP